MKRLFLILLAILMLMPNTASGANLEALTIDERHVYEGMSKSYSDGYMPEVINGTAVWVVPLVTSEIITGDTVTCTFIPDTSDNSPFVFGNYIKTFKADDYTFEDGVTKAFVIRLDIPLKKIRSNGTYKVTMKVKARTSNSDLIEQEFSNYLVVNDGKQTGSETSVFFEIDNNHVYEGMERSYSDGYVPVVEDRHAKIVLPVLTDLELKNDSLRAYVEMDMSDGSPFYNEEYKRTFKSSVISFEDVQDQKVYLIKFDIYLNRVRYNGIYPVNIRIEAEDSESNRYTEYFTEYVVITDGKESPETGDMASSDGTGEAAGEEPIVLIWSNEVNDFTAGDEFSMEIMLRNTSGSKPIKNILVTAECPDPDINILGKSVYLNSINPDASVKVSVNGISNIGTGEGGKTLDLQIRYDTPDEQGKTAAGSVDFIISQKPKIEVIWPELNSSAEAGTSMQVNYQVINRGRNSIYNASISMDIPGLMPYDVTYFGTIDPGTDGRLLSNVFVSSIPGQTSFGYTSGTITLTYEDVWGREYQDSFETGLIINEPVIEHTEEEIQSDYKQWIIIMGVLLALSVIVSAILIIRKKK